MEFDTSLVCSANWLVLTLENLTVPFAGGNFINWVAVFFGNKTIDYDEDICTTGMGVCPFVASVTNQSHLRANENALANIPLYHIGGWWAQLWI